MEHCQFISKENAIQAKSLGIILSMQPNFSYDSVQYKDRISQNYCLQNNPFRMLIDTAGFIPGEDLIFGSDGIPHGIEYGLTMSLFPPFQSQKLALDEFVAGYCMKDMSQGYIDIKIDEDKLLISYKITVK
jgi:predicted amidohydrolase YtcJ